MLHSGGSGHGEEQDAGQELQVNEQVTNPYVRQNYATNIELNCSDSNIYDPNVYVLIK